jgi:hypothetical protein
MTKSLPTSVLFLIFNRPDTTQQVFDEIRKAQPSQLFVAADGPRKDRHADYELCKKTREIIQKVDWDCRVSTLFRDENLGCKYAVSSAIDWFFSNVEEGIILEDDCVPDQSFFPFCQELLEKYRNDKRVMMISGDNFQFGRKRTDYSYYFSRYCHIWGWATWRRAWVHYDVEMKLWPKVKQFDLIKDFLQDSGAENYWKRIFDKTYSNKINTWDYQWVFACWTQNGLSIAPNINLISNIGCDSSATHPSTDSCNSNIPANRIDIPLRHPEFIIRNTSADKYTQKYVFEKPSGLLVIPVKDIFGRLKERFF